MTPQGRRLALALASCALVFGGRMARAHNLNTSYTAITVLPDALTVTISFDLADLAAHFKIDADQDGRISGEELRAAQPELSAYARSHVQVALGDAPLPLEFVSGGVRESPAGPELLDLQFRARRHRPGARIGVVLHEGLFELFGQDHTNLVVLQAGTELQQAVLSLAARSQDFRIGQPRRLASQLQGFAWLGIKHICLGYDHLAFLLALVIIGGRLLQLVKIVTAFTVAHSVTLILAALQVITLPPRLVEAGIAFTIAYVAAENLIRPSLAHRWILTFAFGLVHGFGFANVLRELGLPSQGLVASLLAFNVGVELGQLALVALLFPLSLWLARAPSGARVVRVVSALILACGLGWLIERVFGLSVMPF